LLASAKASVQIEYDGQKVLQVMVSMKYERHDLKKRPHLRNRSWDDSRNIH